MDLGFNPANTVRTEFDLGWAGYNGDAAAHFQRELLDRVSRLPGVQAAGFANATPLSLEVEHHRYLLGYDNRFQGLQC